MMIVELEVPSFGNIYQFNLNENTQVELLIHEIVEMICQREHCERPENIQSLILCSQKTKKVLSRYGTLSEQQITGADYLILV